MSPSRTRPSKAPLEHRTRVGRERRARTRLHIIETALKVFAEKGLEIPVIDDFVKAAGIARGTYYNYYRSTEELLEAVAQLLENDIMESIEREIHDIVDPVVRMTTGVRLWLNKADADPDWCGFIIRTFHRGSLVEKMLGEDLTAGFSSGVFRIPSVTCARDLVVGTILEAMRRINARSVPATEPSDVARMILTALGLSRAAVEKAMRRPIPTLRRQTRNIT